MKIGIACDHGGLDAKNEVIEHLKNKGYEVEDFGCYTTDSCDYSDFGAPCARAVAAGKCERGIVICTTGIGMGICANKIKGIRCAICHNVDCALMTRRHNDANMMSFGAKYVSGKEMLDMVDTFLTTEFEGGRHQRRVDKVMSLESV